MFYHILFVNETILLYVGFYGLYTGYGFFFVDRSPSFRYSIPFKIIIEVKGTERFGVIDHYSSTPNCKYRPDVIHYDYDRRKARFFDSTPGEFFIFFPRDWHIAKVANDGEDQTIRVIVVKVDYKD